MWIVAIETPPAKPASLPHRSADNSLLWLARTGSLPDDVSVNHDLLARARDHRMSALVHHAVQNQGLQGEPEVLQNLAADSLEAMGRSRMAAETLARLVELSEGRFQIGVAKGLAYDLTLYPSRGIRQFADLDIFLHHQDMKEFGNHITALGDSEVDVDLVNKLASSGRTYEHTVRVGQIWVDVHNDIINLILPIRDKELFWSQLVPLCGEAGVPELGEAESVVTLDLELALIQALANFSRDLFTDLRHLNDIRLMLDRDIDWEVVASYSRSEGWYDLVASSLGIVCGYLERPSPLSIESRAVDLVARQILWPKRLRLQGRSRVSRIRTGQARASLLIKGRRGEVMRELVRRVVPPHEVLDLLGYGASGPRWWRVVRYRWNQAKMLQDRKKRVLY